MSSTAVLHASRLDTSGTVEGSPYVEMPDGQKFLAVGWAMLSPFAQGYVEALFKDFIRDQHAAGIVIGARAWPDGSLRQPRFSDLAPEALAMILRDCEAMQGVGLAGTADVGRSAWSARQAGLCTPSFPPTRIYLNDAGQVAVQS